MVRSLSKSRLKFSSCSAFLQKVAWLRGSLGMLAKILKHNDAAIVVLPDSVLRAAGLRLGDEVDVAASSGGIEIRRRDLEDRLLETLIAGMTEENCHASVDYGVVGREIL